MQYTQKYDSPLGGILLASDGKALTGLWFDGQKYFGSTLAAQREQKLLPVFEETARWLDLYFSGQEPDFTPPLSLQQASSFRREVWEIMLTIPYGQTMTYKAIAAELARRRGVENMSAHAVGGAVSAARIFRFLYLRLLTGGAAPICFRTSCSTIDRSSSGIGGKCRFKSSFKFIFILLFISQSPLSLPGCRAQFILPLPNLSSSSLWPASDGFLHRSASYSTIPQPP